jgi:BirA family biotin operon repressor/biotin-[acetyl-CoA-carboxylase] ligase
MNPNPDSKLLKLLKNADGSFVSGEELSEKLDMTRAAVWKRIVLLREAGYRISASTRNGYKFVSAPDRVLPDEILDRLKKDRVIGRQVLSFAQIDSTNRLALEMGAKGSPEGLVIFAEEQTKGRGRLGRTWVSPKGKGLYFSVLLRPRLALNGVPKLTLTAAVSVAEAIEETTGLRPLIRWPNDLLVDGKKICGILTEMAAEADRIGYVVLGIGVNVNASKKELPENGASIQSATRRAQDRCALAARILQKLDAHYADLLAGRFEPLAERWEQRSAVTGKRVAATTLAGRLEGTAVGIDEDGALWIRQDSGIRKRILSGDILFLR